ncbi:hypothetical protein Anapl_01594 [Anas platyrhynchos]|uniref:Uncharacterized protein n=1 Tax=Anas platyrhynchos TaxID=8839 RepID=R0LAJ8_ANAPL|nr:hypothetical protein Anapl_01594 [Anas platyrhynchos]
MPAPISKFNGERGEKISSENRFGSLQIASYLRTNPCSRQQQQFSELRQSKAALWLPDMQRKKQNGLLEGLHALLLMVSTTMSTTSQYLGSHKCSVHTAPYQLQKRVLSRG